jgi:predicted nucleic acid-binding protein
MAQDDPEHPTISEAVAQLGRSGHEVCYTPQVMREVYAVCTRPKGSNGLGMEPEVARDVLQTIESGPLTFLEESPKVHQEWRSIVDSVEVRGGQTYDASHAAAIKAHGVTHILTRDRRDFNRYAGVEVIRPENVRAPKPDRSSPERAEPRHGQQQTQVQSQENEQR